MGEQNDAVDSEGDSITVSLSILSDRLSECTSSRVLACFRLSA